MKKFAAIASAALIAVSAVIPVSAKGAEMWTGGNGYLVDGDNSAVTVKETKDGVQVSHGGYYVDGIDWGGVAYTEAVKLDGFSVELRIDKLPDTGTDTWFSVGFMQKPQLFQVGGSYSKNKGISNLIRWKAAEPFVQSYGPDAWQAIDTAKNAAFGLKEGSTLKVSVALKDGKYILTVNGVELTNAAYNSAFAEGGKAYPVISCSMKDSPKDGFVYTITKVNGKPAVTTAAAKPAAAPSTSDASFAIAALAIAALAGALCISKKH